MARIATLDNSTYYFKLLDIIFYVRLTTINTEASSDFIHLFGPLYAMIVLDLEGGVPVT